MRPPCRARGVAALLMAGLAACAQPIAAPPPAAPTAHAIESPRLLELMQALERLARERLPQAMDLEQERTRRLYKVARAAEAIAESAAQLDASIANLSLPRKERRDFAKHANALRNRARALAKDAHRLSPQAIRARASEIEATCEGCHRAFRPQRARIAP